MEQKSDNSKKIESQIREAYGKVMYTQIAHAIMVERMLKNDKFIKFFQIILSALTTGGFITAIIINKDIASIVGALLSTILLIFSSLTKNFNFIEDAKRHCDASNLLWKIREEYVSLLVDFDKITYDEIIKRRDDLQKRTFEVYSTYPQTDSNSYNKARNSIKNEEAQTFSEEEIDLILPNSVRKYNKKRPSSLTN